MSTFVQETGAQVSSGSSVPSPSYTPTAGNSLIWIAVGLDFSNHVDATLTPNDTQGNAYVLVGHVAVYGSLVNMSYGYVKTVLAGSANVTTLAVTSGTATQSSLGIYVQERSGIDQVAPFHTGENVGQGLTPTTTTDAATSGNTPTLFAQPATLFGFAFDFSGLTGNCVAGTGFTQRGAFWNNGSGTNFSLRVEDKALTALTAVAATFTATSATDGYYINAMVLKDAAAVIPVPGPLPQLRYVMP